MEEQDLLRMSFKRHKSPEIDKFSLDSIWADDASEKLKGYADILTTGLSSDNGNFVLNVNGAWGSGKTFFIERWVAYLEKREYAVVNFNAWKNDCGDDPLLSLFAVFINELEKRNILNADREKLKESTKGTLDVTIHGVCSIFGLGATWEKYKKNVENITKENGIIDFNLLDRASEKIKATETFKEALTEFSTKVVAERKKPIIIFVDELDRCRPTFAIELLERIKHLFDIDGIKFVVVSDTTQLCASIKKVYGAGFDSQTYLRRFFDQTFELNETAYSGFTAQLFGKFEEYKDKNNDICFTDFNHYDFISAFADCSKYFKLTFRDMGQIERKIHTAVMSCTNKHKFNFYLISFLAILKDKDPKTYSELINEERIADTMNSKAVINSKWSELKDKYFKELHLIAKNIYNIFGDTNPNIVRFPEQDFITLASLAEERGFALDYDKILENKETKTLKVKNIYNFIK